MAPEITYYYDIFVKYNKSYMLFFKQICSYSLQFNINILTEKVVEIDHAVCTCLKLHILYHTSKSTLFATV